MNRLKAYFFQKDLEEFKKSSKAKPTKRTSSLLFVLDNESRSAANLIKQINTLTASSKYRKYFLIHDPSGELEEKSSQQIFTKKDLNWRSGFKNLEAIQILRKAHHLIIFPQDVTRKEFEFISKAAASNFKIGHLKQSEIYELDIALSPGKDTIEDFINQINTYLPELINRDSGKSKEAKQLAEAKDSGTPK